MSLLRRRMMGTKQSSFQLVEVENVATWGYQVTNDAREYGWTLEKPYHLSFSSIAAWKYIVMLTDSPFVCADTVDANVNVVSDFNVFVPAIGKYSVGQTTYSPNRDISAQEAQNETSVVATGYPQSEIYDSLGRKWIKIVFAGNDNSGKHKTISYKSMPVYYCVENDLGKVFPERRWDKHYYVYPDVKVILETSGDWRTYYASKIFYGLKTASGQAAVISDLQNDASVNLGGELQGYLIEVPSYADQCEIIFSGYSATINLASKKSWGINLDTAVGTVNNSYTYINAGTGTPVYICVDINTSNTPSVVPMVSVISWSEW